MHFKIIENLKRADPKRRGDLLLRMREKNIKFLQKFEPKLAEAVEKAGTGHFEIRIDQQFLEILDRNSKEIYHPPGELLPYMQQLGGSYHTGWVEHIRLAPIPRGGSEHGKLILRLLTKLEETMPDAAQRVRKGEVKLPIARDGRGYSGPVIFFGIFAGLHIMHYLNHNEARDVFLIEPDFDRFLVSVCFIDYEYIHTYFGHLLLHVGPDIPPDPITILLNYCPVTAASWVRILPAYPHPEFDAALAQIKLRANMLTEAFVPFDREVRNLTYAMRNLESNVRLMGETQPALSAASVIAVVASGPSLTEDLPWLFENQDKLIIFSATSTVRVLRQQGIRIDFQFALDTEISEETFQQLQMPTDVPLVTYYKLQPEAAARFDTVLFVVERYKANPAAVRISLTGTHPTTGNLANAVAAWAKPATLLLVGFDLGFRHKHQSHVAGAMYDDDDGKGHLAETGNVEEALVESNFPESKGSIYSGAYLNAARLSLQVLLDQTKSDQRRVINFSDGASIKGAEPMRSRQFMLPDYPQRQADVQRILEGFSAKHGSLWQYFPDKGADRLNQFRDALVKHLEMDKFEWRVWAARMDTAAMYAAHASSGVEDRRMEVYTAFASDLLAAWYRVALLSQTLEEAQALYEAGHAALKDCLDSIEWPEELS